MTLEILRSDIMGSFAIREWFERNLPALKYHGTPIEELLEEQMREDFYHFEGNSTGAQALRLVSKLHFLVDEKWNESYLCAFKHNYKISGGIYTDPAKVRGYP